MVELTSYDLNNLRSVFRYDRTAGYTTLRPNVAAALGITDYAPGKRYVAGPIQDRILQLGLLDPKTVERAPAGSTHFFTAAAQSAHVAALNSASPPPPHPDASNQAIGPNLGGADGVVLPGDMPSGTGQPSGGSGAGGLILLAGGLLLVVLLVKKK